MMKDPYVDLMNFCVLQAHLVLVLMGNVQCFFYVLMQGFGVSNLSAFAKNKTICDVCHMWYVILYCTMGS